MKFYTRYNPPESPAVRFEKPSLTEQSHAEEVNINSLIARFNRTGVLGTPTQVREMFFGDFSEIGTRFDAECDIARAKQEFLSLPSSVRAEFSQDPRQFLAEIDKLGSDQGVLDKFVRLGLVHAPASAVGTVEHPADVSPAQKLAGEISE